VSKKRCSLLYFAEQLIILSLFLWADCSGHYFRGEVWSRPRIVKRIFNFGGCGDMPICCGFWVVMGSTWVDSSQWDISIGNPVSRAGNNSSSKPSVHFHNCSGLPCPSLRIQVWDLPLLFWVDYHHDRICLSVPTWNQGDSHWRDVVYVEEALVLEKNMPRLMLTS